ncbi:unnamed protein product, partial [Ectocarpus fasciculatus]
QENAPRRGQPAPPRRQRIPPHQRRGGAHREEGLVRVQPQYAPPLPPQGPKEAADCIRSVPRHGGQRPVGGGR